MHAPGARWRSWGADHVVERDLSPLSRPSSAVASATTLPATEDASTEDVTAGRRSRHSQAAERDPVDADA